MPAPPTEQVDVQALLERLRDELRWGANGSSLSMRARARSAAEQFWAVTAERPPHGSPPVQFLKRALRKAMRWYVEPLAQQQRSFNDATLKLIDALFEELDRVSADRDTRGRLIAEFEERLLRLERRPAGSQQTVAAQPAAAALPDYFAFESRMRGPTELVRERQRPYVDDLRDYAPVLDVGCGRGEFLDLLATKGIRARGLDLNQAMVEVCLARGLDVTENDALSYLRDEPDESLGGLIALQVVEHLEPDYLLRLLEEAQRTLRPGSTMVLETINVACWLAFFESYIRDITHQRPLHPDTLKYLVTASGFVDVAVQFGAPIDPANRLQPVSRAARTAGDDALRALADTFDGNVERLNRMMFTHLDYAVIAKRP